MPLRRNRLVIWIAASAVLLQALWPLLSHARPKEPSLQVPVCTIDGVTHYLDLSSGKLPAKKPGALAGDHCALCVFGSDRTAALPAEPVAPIAVVEPVVDQANSLPVPLAEPLNHPPAQPRAPPRSS